MDCWSFLGVAALVSVITSLQAENRRVCYLSNWAQYRRPPATFFPSQMDPSLCSHILFASAVISPENLIKTSEWNDDIPGGLYEQTIALKEVEPELKVSISVADLGNDQVVKMLSSLGNMLTFINSVIPFCRDRGFDGVDLNFGILGTSDSPPQAKYQFSELIREFREAITDESDASGMSPLLLTAAVSARKTKIDAAYEVPYIIQYVDFLGVLTYDFNGHWDNITGMNSPLYPRTDEFGDVYDGANRSTLNVDWAAKYWVELGAPKEKLVIAFATYGRGFTLADATQNGVGAPSAGPSRNGSYTKENGFLSYYEICLALSRPNEATRVFHDEHMNPYAHNGDQWVGYDDEHSIQLKVEYIVENGFSGWMVWTVDLDDFSGDIGCNAGPFPLLRVANEVLQTALITQVSTDSKTEDSLITAITPTGSTKSKAHYAK